MFSKKEVEQLLEGYSRDTNPVELMRKLPPAEKKIIGEMLLREAEAAAPSEPAARPTDRRDSIKAKLRQFNLHQNK